MFGDVFANAVKDIYLMGGNHQGEYTYIYKNYEYVCKRMCTASKPICLYILVHIFIIYIYITLNICLFVRALVSSCLTVYIWFTAVFKGFGI